MPVSVGTRRAGARHCEATQVQVRARRGRRVRHRSRWRRILQDPVVDLVILAASNSDLALALDEVRRLGSAKIETFC